MAHCREQSQHSKEILNYPGFRRIVKSQPARCVCMQPPTHPANYIRRRVGKCCWVLASFIQSKAVHTLSNLIALDASAGSRWLICDSAHFFARFSGHSTVSRGSFDFLPDRPLCLPFTVSCFRSVLKLLWIDDASASCYC